MSQRITGVDGVPITWYKEEKSKDGSRVPQDEVDQAHIGFALAVCLLNYKPPNDKPSMIIYANKVQQNIIGCVKCGKKYRVGQLGINILQDAWRQMMKNDNRRLDNNFMAQAGAAIGIKPESSDIDMTGLE